MHLFHSHYDAVCTCYACFWTSGLGFAYLFPDSRHGTALRASSMTATLGITSAVLSCRACRRVVLGWGATALTARCGLLIPVLRPSIGERGYGGGQQHKGVSGTGCLECLIMLMHMLLAML